MTLRTWISMGGEGDNFSDVHWSDGEFIVFEDLSGLILHDGVWHYTPKVETKNSFDDVKPITSPLNSFLDNEVIAVCNFDFLEQERN